MSEETKKDQAIQESMEFVTGEEGWYIKKTNALFHAVVKVGKNPTADEIEEKLIFHGKKIPGPMFRSWQTFCRDVCMRARGDSEAGLILLYHPVKKTWDAIPPKQDLSVVHVDFSGVTEAIQKFRQKHGSEWLIAGTLHSHPGSAHPSTIDEKDEANMDGVHLIVPDFGRGGEKGITARIVASKTAFRVDEVPDFLVDFSLVGVDRYPKEWVDQCKFDAAGGRRKWAEHTTGDYGFYGGSSRSSFQTGNEFFVNGEGANTHKLTIDQRTHNVMHQSFEQIEPGALLKKLGFPKSHRKWLLHHFEDDMKDLASMFDYCLDALKTIKEVRGDFVHSDRIKAIQDVGRAVEVSLEMMRDMATRILEQSENSPASQKGKEEQPEDDDDTKEAGDTKDVETVDIEDEGKGVPTPPSTPLNRDFEIMQGE